MPAHQSLRPDLRRLSDSDLVESTVNPTHGDRLVINTNSGLLFDGNGRAYELLRRANDPDSSISLEPRVPVEYYTPDYSMFPDMDPKE